MLTHRIRVFFQPIVHIRSGKIAGFEALVRGPVGSDIGPAQLFAQTPPDRVPRLECHIAHLAYETIHDRLTADQFLSINVRPDTLTDEEWLATIRDLQGKLDSNRLVVEVTEVVSRNNLTEIIQEVGERCPGLQFAVDDFGAGDASYERIVEINPRFVKLDLSIIRGIDRLGTHYTTADAAIRFAHGGGIDIIAEGVETAQEAQVVRELGADYGQGYFWSRPAPIEQLA